MKMHCLESRVPHVWCTNYLSTKIVQVCRASSELVALEPSSQRATYIKQDVVGKNMALRDLQAVGKGLDNVPEATADKED